MVNRLPRPCVAEDCPSLAYNGPRCAYHERAYNAVRNAAPERAAYRDPNYRAMYRGGRCYLCGHLGADTLDHVIPLSRGGTNDPANLRPAHRSCNSSKGAAGDPCLNSGKGAAGDPGPNSAQGATGDPTVNSQGGAA